MIVGQKNQATLFYWPNGFGRTLFCVLEWKDETGRSKTLYLESEEEAVLKAAAMGLEIVKRDKGIL